MNTRVQPPRVERFGPLELWVGSARHAAFFFSEILGFAVVPHDEHVQDTDRVSYHLQQGGARLVLTGARSPTSPVAEYVHRHGDGVRDIGFEVDDLEATLGRLGPHVRAFGDAIHSFHPPMPAREVPTSEVGIVAIDHIAVSVDPSTREQWVRHYEEAFGFERVGHDEHIDVDGSVFDMTTVRAQKGPPGDNVVLVIVEPAAGRRASQISDYLMHFGGPGVHHIAFATNDIMGTVAALRRRGLRTLDVPPHYYADAKRRLVQLDVPWDELERMGVLVDCDESGHLFQIFTEPIGDRPTVYVEFVQRVGAEGFGHENIRALYYAVVQEQQALSAG